MTLNEFKKLLERKPKERNEYFMSITGYDNPRNAQIAINRKYFDGKHWHFDEDGLSNQTMSGKMPWVNKAHHEHVREGERGFSMPARRARHNDDILFTHGQLQTNNYVRMIGQTYQDFTGGNNNQKVSVNITDIKDIVIDEEEIDPFLAINTELSSLWKDAGDFIKTQVLRGYLDTVMTASLDYMSSTNDYLINYIDPLQLFPVYEYDKRVGTLQGYQISGAKAKVLYGVDDVQEDDKVSYIRGTVLIDGSYKFFEFVNGKKVNESDLMGKTESSDAQNYDPVAIQANIDHPYQNFDDYTLEDSEIFNVIDKNDALNSLDSMGYITNLKMAMPTAVIDWDVIDKIGMDPRSPDFQQFLKNFNYFSGSVNNAAVKLIPGQVVPDQFYKHLERLERGLYEFAGVPRFIVSGEGLSAISQETMNLAMAILIRKITQKREKVSRLIGDLSIKFLKAKGLIAPELEYEDITFSINYPALDTMSDRELVDYFTGSGDLFPQRYKQRVVLESLGRTDDIAEVKEASQEALSEIRTAVEERRRAVQAEQEAERQLQQAEQTETELAEVESRIQTLQQ